MMLAGCGVTELSPIDGAAGAIDNTGSTGSGAGASSQSGFGHSGSGASGSGGSSASGSSGSGPGATPELDINGTWAMFGFEDPVAVDIEQRGSVLSGKGCFLGLEVDGVPHPLGPCTPLTGRIVNGRAEFAFMALEYRYAADAFVAKSGDRMAGRFHGVSSWYGPTAWLRIDPSQRWLAHDKRLGTALREHQGSYDLTLDPSNAPGDAFSTDRSYALSLGVNASPLIFGDLGAFWASEMAWREPTLTIGPVPATHPELPVALELRFRDTVLHEVTATMPEGERYVFTAAPTP